MSKNRGRDRAARAHMNATGSLRARAARTVDTTTPEATVATTAFLLDAAIPSAPDPSRLPSVTPEALFASYVARSAHEVTRDGVLYPVFLDVYVVRPPEEGPQPGDAPDGWRNIGAFCLITARRPWDLEDEDQRVITDVYRAAKATLNRVWPGLPDWAGHAALSLDMLASLRGRFTDEAVLELVHEMQASAIHHTWTLGADEELDRSRW
ncbi:hypothetical protein [Streptomyces sp. NPDC058084]|uniref:hypothetical protein n=1 Tax=Streptomyces sp. NPDC058084 TaxID=3346333 RepID=UPI0036E5BA9A